MKLPNSPIRIPTTYKNNIPNKRTTTHYQKTWRRDKRGGEREIEREREARAKVKGWHGKSDKYADSINDIKYKTIKNRTF